MIMLSKLVSEIVETLNDCSTSEIVRIYNEIHDKNINPEEVETDEYTLVHKEEPHR